MYSVYLIVYIKSYVLRKVKTPYNLEWMEYYFFSLSLSLNFMPREHNVLHGTEASLTMESLRSAGVTVEVSQGRGARTSIVCAHCLCALSIQPD